MATFLEQLRDVEERNLTRTLYRRRRDEVIAEINRRLPVGTCFMLTYPNGMELGGSLSGKHGGTVEVTNFRRLAEELGVDTRPMDMKAVWAEMRAKKAEAQR